MIWMLRAKQMFSKGFYNNTIKYFHGGLNIGPAQFPLTFTE